MPRAPGQAKILVVDDNEDILNVIQRILSHQTNEKYHILTATDGRAALEVARKELPDLILLDVMLPEIDGLTVCKELKSDASTRGTMILLVTGRGSIEHRAEGLDAGADDYIPKPFHITELLARVRSALRIKRLTDELRDRNRQLVESQRDRLRAEKMATIGLLATGLAHEFNNIMSGISGYAQLAKKNAKFRDQLVEVALIQSERALELTRSLSTFYRPSAANRPTELASVIHNALCLVQKEVDERHIKVEKDLPSVSPVLGSPGQLQEVVLNLVINAIHAIDTGGEIGIQLSEKDGRVCLTVKDNGCGIPPDHLERIFDPFFTTKGALGGGTTGGSGLGLSVSYNIVRAHAGTISVKSAPGQGATFFLSFPAMLAVERSCRAPEAGTEGGALKQAAVEAAARTPKKTGPDESPERLCHALLVADADEAVQEMVSQYLTAGEVVSASEWNEALGQFSKRRFDFVMLDVDLPGSPDPRKALDALRALDREVRVILTSRRYLDGPAREAAELAWGHLLKPYTVENLTVMIARQLVAAS
jgi:signal transduction histidine kinase